MSLKVLCVVITILTLYCAPTSRAEDSDDLVDFDFDSENENENASESLEVFDYEKESTSKSNESKLDDFGDEFGDENDSFENDATKNENNKSSFNNKEKAIRKALTKAFTNKALRQKFIEIVPILRVLSKPQKLAFAALISTQINAKPGKELKLKQVESMFGDSRKLLLPLVFDIANLVKNAAKSVQTHSYDYNYEDLPEPVNQINRRNYEVTSAEEDEYEYVDGVLDAKLINEQLYATDMPRNETSTRSKRSAPLSFFERLSFLMPKFAQRRVDQVDENRFQDRRLNLTNRIVMDEPQALSSDISNSKLGGEESPEFRLSYEQVEDLALGDLNETDFKQNVSKSDNESIPEELPTPESLIGSRRRPIGNKLGHGYRKSAPYRHPVRPYKTITSFGNCEKFTSSMCIRTEDYPMDQIMGSIRRHKHAMSALLAEYRDKSAELEQQEFLDDLLLNKKRRGDEDAATGGMCSSVIRFARPQKARSASGEWKYIVNTGQHTQTLRLEKCSNPQESCSYLTENYRSRCIQVYNYHRLLSWDKTRGLHVDIFKVPTCCSCHIDGYREAFPPVGSNFGNKVKDYSPHQHVVKPNTYSTLTDDDDYDDDEENGAESIAYQYSNGFKRVKSNKYDALYSSSNAKSNYDHPKSATKSVVRLPPLGSYLSPPSDEFDPNYPFKRGPDLTPNSGSYLGGLSTGSRRPFNSNSNQYSPAVSDDRLDQEISGSEIGKEVTVYPTIDRSTVRPKRKRISSVSTAQQSTSTGQDIIPGLSATTPANDVAYQPPKSILNTKLATSKTDVNKRINYNYHPIIDFFEEQALISSAPFSTANPSPKKPRRVTTVTDRRIGPITIADNNWRPVIIE